MSRRTDEISKLKDLLVMVNEQVELVQSKLNSGEEVHEAVASAINMIGFDEASISEACCYLFSFERLLGGYLNNSPFGVSAGLVRRFAEIELPFHAAKLKEMIEELEQKPELDEYFDIDIIFLTEDDPRRAKYWDKLFAFSDLGFYRAHILKLTELAGYEKIWLDDPEEALDEERETYTFSVQGHLPHYNENNWLMSDLRELLGKDVVLNEIDDESQLRKVSLAIV